MKGRPLGERMGFAVTGWRECWRRERSFRTQSLIAAGAVVVLLVLRPAPIWWALIAVVGALVLALELLNSAFEAVIDLLHPGVHEEIRVAKDMVSGAVLAVGVAALIVAVAMIIDGGWA